MPNIGPMELVFVLVIALIVMGPKRLPAMGRSLGTGMREFKDSLGGTAAEPVEVGPGRRVPDIEEEVS